MRNDLCLVDLAVAKQFQTVSVDVVQLVIAKVLNLVEEVVKGLPESTRYAPSETEFLTGLEV